MQRMIFKFKSQKLTISLVVLFAFLIGVAATLIAFNTARANKIYISTTFFSNLFNPSIASTTFKLANVTIVNSDSVMADKDIIVSGGIIQNIQDHTTAVASGTIEIDLGGLMAYPSLVNAHDHFSLTWPYHAGYYPKKSAEEWMLYSLGLSETSVFNIERGHFDFFYKAALSAYKQIFAGVTTADDFGEGDYRSVFNMPIRLVNTQSVHSVYADYVKPNDYQLVVDIYNATGGTIPWTIHIEESLNAPTNTELDTVKRKIGGIRSNMVLVHGPGFSQQDISEIVSAGASIVWAPYSIWFVIDYIADVQNWLNAGINVALGTDGSNGGSANMLEEMRFAKTVRPSLSSQEIMKMSTINGAKAFKLDSQIGSIAVGKKADILIARASSSTPYDSLVNLKSEDIALLMSEGKPLYGDDSLRISAFGPYLNKYETVIVSGVSKFIIGYPTQLVNAINNHLGYKKDFEFMPYDKSAQGVPTVLAPTVTAPNSGTNFTTTQAMITLSGTVSTSTNNVLVNWSSNGVSYTSGQTNWSYPATLRQGVNYFAIRAKKNDSGTGVYSKLDDIIITLTPTFANPNTGVQAQTMDVVISGANFASTTAVTFGSEVTVNNFNIDNPNQITANITIDPSAAGSKDVSVSTAYGTTGVLTNGFSVSTPYSISGTVNLLNCSGQLNVGPTGGISINLNCP